MGKVFGHGGGLSKIGHGVKNTAKSYVKQALINPIRGTGHIFQAGGYLAQGNFSKAGQSFDKAVTEYTTAAVSHITGGLTPGLAEKVGQIAGAVTAYSYGNFNRGSQYIEDVTGYDLDNSIAEAKTEAALAAQQREIDAENARADAQRRANLLSLRKQVGAVNVGAKSTVFSGGGETDKKTATGVVLG